MMEAATTASYGPQSQEKPSQTIVKLIADLEGTPPTELSPPLYSAIDPEALDSLFHPPTTTESQTRGHVCFSYLGYEIRVEETGEIEITDA